MFTNSEMVPLDDDLFLKYGQTASTLVTWFLTIPCAVFWAQNGRKTGPLGAQNGLWLVSKGSRINRNFAESWSGRWESNPRPKLGSHHAHAVMRSFGAPSVQLKGGGT